MSVRNSQYFDALPTGFIDKRFAANTHVTLFSLDFTRNLKSKKVHEYFCALKYHGQLQSTEVQRSQRLVKKTRGPKGHISCT